MAEQQQTRKGSDERVRYTGHLMLRIENARLPRFPEARIGNTQYLTDASGVNLIHATEHALRRAGASEAEIDAFYSEIAAFDLHNSSKPHLNQSAVWLAMVVYVREVCRQWVTFSDEDEYGNRK